MNTHTDKRHTLSNTRYSRHQKATHWKRVTKEHMVKNLKKVMWTLGFRYGWDNRALSGDECSVSYVLLGETTQNQAYRKQSKATISTTFSLRATDRVEHNIKSFSKSFLIPTTWKMFILITHYENNTKMVNLATCWFSSRLTYTRRETAIEDSAFSGSDWQWSAHSNDYNHHKITLSNKPVCNDFIENDRTSGGKI